VSIPATLVLDASTSTKVVLSGSKICKMGGEVISFFRIRKAFSCSSPQMMGSFLSLERFLSRSVIGFVSPLKFQIKFRKNPYIPKNCLTWRTLRGALSFRIVSMFFLLGCTVPII
jgi:hypothetical protein